MIRFVVRVWLPDRPGALGQVASRIGAVRGDVIAIEILETGGGRAVDELTVGLPDRDLLPLLTAEIGAVDGVSVESIREVDADRAEPNLAVLALGASLAEVPTGERLHLLIDGVQRVTETEWVAVLCGDQLVAHVGTPPELAWLTAFLAGSEHLGELDDGVPGDVAWARLPRAGLQIATGRSGDAIHERERVRVSLLARLADALLAPGA